MNQKQETVISKIWRVIAPLVTYYFVQMLVTVGVSAVFAIRAVSELDLQAMSDMQTVYDALMGTVFSHLLDISFWCTVISGVLAFPILVWFHNRDKKRPAFISAAVDTAHPLGHYFYPLFIMMGGVAAFAKCCMLVLGGYYRGGADIESSFTFSQSLPVLLVGLGVISPIVEELIFRVVMYDRIKEYLKKPLWAGLISCAVYGFLHQEMTEMAYAFCFGALFAYAYEKTHDWKIPVIAHIAASVVEILFAGTDLFYFIFTSREVLYGSTGAACVLVVVMIYQFEMRLAKVSAE